MLKGNGYASGYGNQTIRLWGNSVRTCMVSTQNGATSKGHGRCHGQAERVYSIASDIAGVYPGDDKKSSDGTQGRSGQRESGETSEDPPLAVQHERITGWLKQNWPQLPKHDGLATVFLILAVICFCCQIMGIKQAIRDSRRAEPAPVVFSSPWRPDKPVVYAGQALSFRYTRNSKIPGAVLYQVDSINNVRTGESYPGAVISRIVERTGIENLESVRHIAAYTRPGIYRLEGFCSSQTEVPSRTVPYYSDTFEVKKKDEKSTPRKQ